MPAAKKLQTNFTAGELSPRIEGRPDLAKYFNGCKALENFLVYPQGGAFRRPGTRFVKEVKTSSQRTRLVEFIVNNTTAYVLEFGHQYIRFYKNGAQLMSGGSPYEVATPYSIDAVFDLEYRQSVDVLFMVHQGYAPRKLSRFSDTNWTLTQIAFSPPPTYEADLDLVSVAGISANTGTGKNVRAKFAFFVAADVGKNIVLGVSRAVITAFTSATEVVVDILDAFNATITAGPATLTSAGTTVTSVGHGAAADDFIVLTGGAQAGEIRRITSVTDANTIVIDAAFSVDQAAAVAWNKVIAFAASTWFIQGSPGTTLLPSIAGPVGAQVTLTAGANAFRVSDLNKYVKVFGGVVRLTSYTSATVVKGTILQRLSQAASPIVAAPIGSWTLEAASWSPTRGYPQAIEFHEGRLLFGGSLAQPTTFWGSVSDDYDNFAVGVLADDAIEYTIASRRINPLLWLFSHKSLFLGTSENELIVQSPQGLPLGGDVTPEVSPESEIGSKRMLPCPVSKGFLLVDASGRKVYDFLFDVVQDGLVPTELTLLSDHVTKGGIYQDKIAYQKTPHSIAYMVRADGQLLALTYYRVPENIVAWSRIVTDGEIESVAAIPHPDGDRVQVWVTVKRTIGGATKRYVEYFEDQASEFSARNWEQLLTDSAVVYSGAAATSITGLTHLEGKEVDVVADGSYKGRKTVASGAITLSDAATKVEVGLPYTSTLKTMRPAIPNAMVEGYKRKWNAIFLRLEDSIGATVNGEEVLFNAGGQAMDGAPALFTGDKQVKPLGWGMDGYITVVQSQPYPLAILAIFGECEFAEQIG